MSNPFVMAGQALAGAMSQGPGDAAYQKGQADIKMTQMQLDHEYRMANAGNGGPGDDEDDESERETMPPLTSWARWNPFGKWG